jgi:hypothetical protein
MGVVMAGQTFAAGLRAEFLKTYEPLYKGLERLDVAMDRDIPSDKYQEKFVYWTSTPYMRRWRRGESMTHGVFKSVQWTVTNLEWALAVPWHFADEQDDQTSSLVSHVRRGAATAALLDERVFYQTLSAGVDAALLSTVPSAPDGVALCYPTDGDGADRFGYSGGNLISGAGVTTYANLQTDYYKALVAFNSFQDTEGQPLLDPSIVDGGVTIFAGEANRAIWEQFVNQRIQPFANSTSNAGVSNVLQDASKKIKVVLTQRISDNDWWIFLDNAPVKPIFSMLRQPQREVMQDFENSDATRDQGEKSMRWWLRKGYGVALPYGVIKVNN